MKRILLAALAALLISAQAAPAQARCLAAPPLWQSLAAAPVVFAGTVTAVEGGERIATVAVDEVWTGEVPRAVQVRGGPADPQVVTSVDRTFAVGTKYLFVPVTASTPFEDNICTATQEYTPEIESSRPLDVSAPGQSGAGIDGRDGADGADGAPGRSGSGTHGRDGADGAPGRSGSDGQPGRPGRPGSDGQPGQPGGTVDLRGTGSPAAGEGPSQAAKAAIFALALGLALAAGWALKSRPGRRD